MKNMTATSSMPPQVLLVDDEVDFLATMVKRLQRRGLTTDRAESGEACLDRLAQNPVPVVVLDVKMPGMSGLETLKIIKRDFPETEVLLLTGNVSTADGVEGIKQGAFDYLTKPVEMDHLLEKIKQAREKIQRRKEQEAEAAWREKMQQQMIAAERLASLGTLSTGVAHEINNPLAMMQEAVGYLQLVLNKQEMADIPRRRDLAKGIDTIAKGVDRIRRITHLLLGFVRQPGQPGEETDLKTLVEETIELTAREIRDRQIRIMREMTPGPAVIWSDPYELRQVLINLLTNAIQAIRKDGTITVGLKDRQQEVVLTITDTGEGIPRENRHRIFEPFFSTKAANQGTGLGLYVTRGLVERLGGTITVDSRLGEGATFRLTLPRCRPDLRECGPETGSAPGGEDILKKVKEITTDDKNSDQSPDC